jgi:cytochrome c
MEKDKMLKTVVTLAAMAALGASLPAQANLALAQKNACMACHAADKKLVGPAYAEVAKKYAGQADAVAKLSDSIKKGGSGKWGPVPMPAQAALSEADANTLAAWVLAGAK